MSRVLGILILAAWIGTLSGCKKDESPSQSQLPAGTVNEVEPNDQTAQSLGALGTTDITVLGSASTTSDVDRYAVTVGASTNLHVAISWSGGGDLDVGVMDPSGIMLTFRSTGANPEQCTLPALAAGSYTLSVSANPTTANAYPQAYTLTVGPR